MAERPTSSSGLMAGRQPAVAGRWVLWIAAWACGAALPLGAQARTVANLVIGDAVVVVKANAEKHVLIGIGTDTHTSTVTANAPAVDEFVAEAQAIVRLGARHIPTHTPDRPVLQEGETGRALSLTRHLEHQHDATVVTYHFFVSDDKLNGYVVAATPPETKAMLLALHRAARVANGMVAAAADTSAPQKP